MLTKFVTGVIVSPCLSHKMSKVSFVLKQKKNELICFFFLVYCYLCINMKTKELSKFVRAILAKSACAVIK